MREFKPKAAVFDIDGTLADGRHRRHVQVNWKAPTDRDIDRWGAGIMSDTPIKPVVRIASLLQEDGYKIILLTSRCERNLKPTVMWMEKHGVNFDTILYRELCDRGIDNHVYKAQQLDRIMRLYDVQIAFDDEPMVVEMFRAAGVLCLQVPSLDKPVVVKDAPPDDLERTRDDLKAVARELV